MNGILSDKGAGHCKNQKEEHSTQSDPQCKGPKAGKRLVGMRAQDASYGCIEEAGLVP